MRNCGATTGVNTQASILRFQAQLRDEGGNVFIADQGEATVSWKTDGSLLVSHSRGLRFFKRETRVLGVAVEYRETRTATPP